MSFTAYDRIDPILAQPQPTRTHEASEIIDQNNTHSVGKTDFSYKQKWIPIMTHVNEAVGGAIC